jgi:hypothetical protein
MLTGCSTLELQAVKEILAEIFHAKPRDIEDMIRSRLDEMNWDVLQTTNDVRGSRHSVRIISQIQSIWIVRMSANEVLAK